ncbi:MAG: hypothetical protein J6S00_04840, partial [Clostridia bacterium]|nr:hypothetical protein [Clostridia bacterium]
EEKQHSRETAKEIFKEDRLRIIKETAADVVDHAAVTVTEELIAKRREKMIEADVFDEYTKVTNVIDFATDGGNFFKNIFKRKK